MDNVSSPYARGVDPLPPSSPARRQWPFTHSFLMRAGTYAVLGISVAFLAPSAPVVVMILLLLWISRLEEQQRVLQQRVEYLMRQQVAGPPTAAAAALQAGAANAVDPQPWLTALEHTPAAAPPPNDAEPPVA